MQGAIKTFSGAPISAKIGLLIISAYACVAIFAPWIAPYSETSIVGSSYELWSDEFIFGTDNIGRDMLSRLIYGARNTIGIAPALIHISEPTRRYAISYAVFCLKKKRETSHHE